MNAYLNSVYEGDLGRVKAYRPEYRELWQKRLNTIAPTQVVSAAYLVGVGIKICPTLAMRTAVEGDLLVVVLITFSPW